MIQNGCRCSFSQETPVTPLLKGITYFFNIPKKLFSIYNVVTLYNEWLGGFFMKYFLYSIPVPISGLMLGVVSLAKILYLVDFTLGAHILFAAGLLLFIALILKVIFNFINVREQLANSAIASVAPTFTMGTMVIASVFWLQNTFVLLANALWLMAVILHVFLMGYFIVRFMIKETVTIQAVLPSWFVTFVGIGMVPITAPPFAIDFTEWIIWFATLNFIILLPFVLKRVFIMRDLPIPVKPMITIIAAPASLILLAYLIYYGANNEEFIYIGLIIAQFFYFLVLYELQTLLKMPFYPSFGAFTFPLIVSATTLFTAFINLPNAPLWLETVFYVELTIATIITLYVFFAYMRYLVVQTKKYATEAH